MPGSSRQHRSEKRRKELARQAKQKEKRERKPGETTERGAGPPIDWTEAAPGVPLPPGIEPPPAPAEEEPKKSE
jgi:hypothetical protein